LHLLHLTQLRQGLADWLVLLVLKAFVVHLPVMLLLQTPPVHLLVLCLLLLHLPQLRQGLADWLVLWLRVPVQSPLSPLSSRRSVPA
jgi:hypothetical protein